MNIQYLSHAISENTPGYAGKKEILIERSKSLECGDSCNQLKLILSNHTGTHIDLPLHFDKDGQSLSTYLPEFFFFNKIGLLEIDLINEDGFLIDLNNYLEKLEHIKGDIDFLIIKTNFELNRNTSRYWEFGPGIHAKSAEVLRTKFSNLRAIGFDFLSLTSFQHRVAGREAHQQFLHKNFGRPICIVEDMSLINLSKVPDELIIAPLLIENGDGSPVTVFAKIKK